MLASLHGEAGSANLLFVVAGAAPLLGARAGGARWIETLVGFDGAAFADSPAAGPFRLGLLIEPTAGAGGAAIVALNRAIGRTETTATIVAWVEVVATFGAAPVAWAQCTPLTSTEGAAIAVAGLLACATSPCADLAAAEDDDGYPTLLRSSPGGTPPCDVAAHARDQLGAPRSER